MGLGTNMTYLKKQSMQMAAAKCQDSTEDPAACGSVFFLQKMNSAC